MRNNPSDSVDGFLGYAIVYVPVKTKFLLAL